MKVWLGTLIQAVLWTYTAGGALPDSFSEWAGRQPEAIPAARLAAAAGSEAPLLREYGFVEGERREYTRGDARLTAMLWTLQDATGSYGVFTHYSRPGLEVEQSSDMTGSAPGLFLMQRGPYVLEVRGEVRREELAELIQSVPTVQGRQGLQPQLPSYLPEEGLIPGTRKFLIGPRGFERLGEQPLSAELVGFDMGAEAAVGHYRGGGTTTQLLLVSYPTPQMAAGKLREFEQLPGVSAEQNVVVERKGTLVAVVTNAPSALAAQQLLERIRYGAELTWNEYVPPRRENVGNMMLAVFSLAGLVLLFAFVAGLAFGGVRVLAKRIIPIPIFDRPTQMEIIQLNLSRR